MLEGKITGDGICCNCCNKMHTIRDFESHAGSGLHKPSKNIYLESVVSHLQCLMDSWSNHSATDQIEFVSVDTNGDDPSDDICSNICADGGDLMCCDAYPSAFHNVCLGIEKVPSGDWICACCSCKLCGVAGKITSKITIQLCQNYSRVICVSKHLLPFAVHLPCIGGKDASRIDYQNPSFCGPEFQKIFDNLQVLLGVKHELEEGYSYAILQHRDVSSNGDSSVVESNSKLALAFSVIDHQCRKNIIHNTVYSCGIHGSQLAEMPFIGTCLRYRRQGMCSRLLKAIETVLGSLGVEKLVILANLNL